jgi:hypothetical protein
MQRRTFLRAAGAAGLDLSGRLGFSASEPPTPLLALLEDVPRERLPHELAGRIRAGLRHEELIAALSLAAVRNVQPYPDVGFKYHAVMMLRSIDQAGQHLPPGERWLPLMWAADYFKMTQAEERASSGWRQSPPRHAKAGSAAAARRSLTAALDRWDRDAADAAIVAYADTASADEVFRVLFWYGARDLRYIGHKAIAAANAHRLAALLDRPQTDSLLRSTVAALQNVGADASPASHDLEPDRPFHRNVSKLRDLPASWRQGRNDPGARAELRAALYHTPPEDAGATAAGLLGRGIAADALWQTLFNTAAELILANPDVLALHAQTTANALHYAYRVCTDEPTQQLALLQCAAFMAMFRSLTGASEQEFNLEALPPLPLDDLGRGALEELSAELSAGHRVPAVRKALTYLQRGGDPGAFMATIRGHVAYYADDPHDYKYSEAVFENFANLPDFDWRCRCLSAGMGMYRAPAPQPSAIVTETLELLKGANGRPVDGP